MNNQKLYLKNCRYVDPFTLKIYKTDLEVEQGDKGRLRLVNLTENVRDFINCEGNIVTGSFVNSHHHIYSALARGMPAPPDSPKNFHEILKYIWWRLDRSLTKEMIRVSAQISAIESLKNGVTSVIDHHSSPNSIEGSLQLINTSLKKFGIDSIVCYEISDRNGPLSVKISLEESEKTLSSGIPGLVGLHASFTVSDELMRNAVNLAAKYDSGIHIHVAESPVDNEISLENYGKRAVKRLKASGVLDFGKTLLAHCIHINDEEREILKNSPAMIIRNPRSNLNNGVGVFDDKDLEAKILIGTDGINSDIISDTKLYYLLKGGESGNSPEKAYNALRRAHEYLKLNSFAGSRENDLVILNYKNTTDLNDNNFPSHFIYGISGLNVDTVISKGKVVLEKGRIAGSNENEIFKHAEELSGYLWEKMKDI